MKLIFKAILILPLSIFATQEDAALRIKTPSYPKTTKPISQSSLSSSAENMYTIQQSGRYYLDTPLQANPSGTNRNVIKITASNVVLDLSGMSISQVHTNAQSGLNGIDVASGVSNVFITNGFINKLSDVGVNVGTNCNNIRVFNVGISNCDGGGAQFDTVTSLSLENVDITKSNGTGTSAPSSRATGLYMTSCSNFLAKNCNFQYNQASGSRNGRGAAVSSCNDGLFLNCKFNSNKGNSTSGISISSCNAVSFESCTFSNNVGTTGESFGLAATSCTAMTVKSCDCSYNTTTGSSGAYGIRTFTSSRAITIENCTCNYNTASSNVSYGIKLEGGDGDIIKNTECTGNQATGANAYGIGLTSSTAGTLIDKCTCANTTTTTSGVSYGISIASGVTNCIVTNNILLNNVGAGNDFGFHDATTSGTGTTVMLGGNISFGHGACTPPDGTNLTNSSGGNYYFQLNTPSSGTNSPDLMIQEIKIGQLAESGTGRITNKGFIGKFGTFDNLSLIQ